MKTSTNVALNGWNNTFVPKNLNVKVADWLAENDFSEKDVESINEGVTFADFKTCICGKNEHGLDIIDTAKCGQFCVSCYMDSFLRDAIFDAIDAIA